MSEVTIPEELHHEVCVLLYDLLAHERLSLGNPLANTEATVKRFREAGGR